jgi:hypothetical protein
MTLANAPLWLETARVSATDLPDGASEIFFARGLDRQMTDLPVGQQLRDVSSSFRGATTSRASDVQLHIAESITTIASMDSGPAPSKSAAADLANDIAELG